MAYVFNGRLCGYLCADCEEPLSEVTVRLYRTREDQDVMGRAVASPKETLVLLSDEEVDAKASSLLAETTTDQNGNFSFELGEKEDYGGEAFEIDVYCGSVPRQPPHPEPPRPLQFSVTTFRPMWRQRGESGYVAFWDYCLPYRFWCAIRARFGAWVICGRVVECETKTPLAGLTVTAFDRDWIQDDPLGADTTDGSGRFRIDYLSPAFEKTPFWFINIELVGGPDVYFRVEQGASVLLAEDPSRGRDPDRENVGACLCVELCVDAPVPPFNDPWFTHIGDFHIYTDINPASGLTNAAVLGHGGPGYGFFGGMKLRGFCPKTSPSGPPDAMRYRFLYEHPDNPGVPVPITGTALVFPVLVGSRLINWDLFGTGPVTTFQSIIVAPSGATPDPTPPPSPLPPPGTPWGPVPAHVIVPDPVDGWVTVDPNGLDNGFYGPLIGFNSAAAVPGGAAPGNGAGNPVADPKNGVAIKLIFEAGPVTGPATFSNQVDAVYVNNWGEVRELNLLQFGGPGGNPCSPLSTDLDVLYTTDHELLADWSLSINSASGSAPGTVIPPLPAGSTPRGHAGTHHENIAAWQPCSYQVWLTTRRKLTNGESDDDANSTLVTFCK